MEARLQRLGEALERPHRLGMIGGELEEQLAHCASFSRCIAAVLGAQVPQTAIDLGTGGGLPGLALACEWLQTHWTLVDMRAGRATEVERAVLRLGLGETVAVVAAPAQELAYLPELRGQIDLVVARSFGPTSLTAECASGFLRVGGALVVSEPPTTPVDRWPASGVTSCGLGLRQRYRVDGHHFVSFRKTGQPSADLPRLPARRDRGWPEAAAE